MIYYQQSLWEKVRISLVTTSKELSNVMVQSAQGYRAVLKALEQYQGADGGM